MAFAAAAAVVRSQAGPAALQRRALAAAIASAVHAAPCGTVSTRAAGGWRGLVAASRGAHLPASRTREINAACAALAESVEAGDGAWFERVVTQLRDVLAENQATTVPVPGGIDVPAGAASSAGWASGNISAHGVTASAPHVTAGLAPGATHMTSVAKERLQSSRDAQFAQPEDSEEPAWMEALRLLEAAASVPPVKASSPARGIAAVRPGSASWSPRAGTATFVEVDELPTSEAAKPDTDDHIAAYLASFDLPSSKSQETASASRPETQERGRLITGSGIVHGSAANEMVEPQWARAMRILEAAVPGHTGMSMTTTPQQDGTARGSKDDHAGEDARIGRLEQLLNRGSPSPEDPRQVVRMGRYAELLREADVASRVAPGGSVPVRFSQLRGPQPPQREHRPLPPPPPPPSAAPSAPSASNLPSASPAMPETIACSSQGQSKRRADLSDPMVQAIGKGNLVSSIPVPGEDEVVDDAVLRKEDFVWSDHEFNDGEKENKRVLRSFTKEFKKMVADTPDGLRDSKLLTAALDLALACVKCYELDKADSIYRRCIGECRRRGMPWDIKCIQDLATLRCKQHRQADAAELLEELASKAPPHPATFINLGTVYNQLRQYDKAEVWFLQAVNLKGGNPGREDHWNLGIAKKNQGKYDEALPMLEQALSEFQEHEPEHPVTIAKLHSSVAGCLHDMGRAADAVEHYQKAHELYVTTVGTRSPLFSSAAEGLAKSLKVERRFQEAFQALLESFEVHAVCDSVHTTPLFEHLEMALQIQGHQPDIPLERLRPLIDAGIENLEARGLAEDGNAGLVMSRGGKVLEKAGGIDNAARAAELLRRGRDLIQHSHDAGEADLRHEVLEADMLLQALNRQVKTFPQISGV
eukprot:CAMPEP_0115577800 /NCGR_PEP_ID=MMETSP0272-20121206/3259_1 /TAXON_ID=71861 /ORGANISM="Scrippsiella trochoidea, Strain CCMP3099" /LENGTH=874 /DNA_ID=CAMNT_0003012623 /DNA_START=1 /DNA_END=2622 /DNA_ORIENTATION=-